MTPAARIDACISILSVIGTVKVPMDTVIGDYMRQRRYIGSKDRAYIAEHVYMCMRHKARFAWLIEKAGGDAPTPRLQMVCCLLYLDGRAQKDVEKLFDGSKYGADPLSSEEAACLEKLSRFTLDEPDMPDLVKAEFPAEYELQLRAVFGEDLPAQARAMLEPATLDLRVNTLKKTRDEVMDSLAQNDVVTEKTSYSPCGLRVQEKTYLSKTKAFSKGWIDIQDEGSQLIALATGAEPGNQVLDYCAGAGGKTIALANMMEGKGRIIAMDNDERRLDRSRARFKRSGVSDNIEVRPLTENRHKKWLRRQKGTFDVVLCDVPCSGSGTWRRNPDMRWINYGPDLDALYEVQAEILEKVVDTVKPGGKLVYATCSLFREENEDQIERFLKSHDDFELLDVSNHWPDGVISPVVGPYMRLTPKDHNTDGFFAAVMQRKSNSETEKMEEI